MWLGSCIPVSHADGRALEGKRYYVPGTGPATTRMGNGTMTSETGPLKSHTRRNALRILALGGAATADALATLTMVLGPVKGRDLLEQLEGCEGYFVSKELEATRTSGFEVI